METNYALDTNSSSRFAGAIQCVYEREIEDGCVLRYLMSMFSGENQPHTS